MSFDLTIDNENRGIREYGRRSLGSIEQKAIGIQQTTVTSSTSVRCSAGVEVIP